MKNLSIIFATIILSGCNYNARLDNLEAGMTSAKEQSRIATAEAARAVEIANEASQKADGADEYAHDALEAVYRMAEKCCSK